MAGALIVAFAPVLAVQSDPEVYYVEGIDRYNAGEYEEAVELLSRAAAIGPAVPDYRYHLGLAYLKVGRPRDAARELEAALGMMGMKRETRVKEPIVLVQAAKAYLQQGDLDTAEARARLALKRGGPSPEAHYLLGLVARERGDEAGSLAELSAVVELDRDHVEANVALSDLSLARGRLDEAREALRHASHGAPTDYDVLMALGELAYRAADLDEAEEAFSRALAVRPGDAGASFDLGTALLAQQRFSEAIDRLVAAAPESDDAAFNLAQAYLGDGREAEARATLEGLVERRPDYPRARFALALVFERAGEGEAAERLYRACLEANETTGPAALNLAALLEREGRESEAVEVLREHLDRVDPEQRRSLRKALALLEGKVSER